MRKRTADQYDEEEEIDDRKSVFYEMFIRCSQCDAQIIDGECEC